VQGKNLVEEITKAPETQIWEKEEIKRKEKGGEKKARKDSCSGEKYKIRMGQVKSYRANA